ncbi:hypothetical protein GF322_03750 [Candidatus Dependentiae bacterium]|nr:hypothetical protein [Candidatus Dependentiae bacterium]
MKKIFFALLILVLNCNLSHAQQKKEKIKFCENELIKTLKQAEKIYTTKSNNKNNDIKKKLDILKKLHFFENKLSKNFTTNKTLKTEKLNLIFKKLQLTKEIIRHLEAHLKIKHNWQETDHFCNILKPLIVSSSLLITTILCLKIAKSFGIISKNNFLTSYKFSTLVSSLVCSLWIFKKYKID